jgi:hypothetical protein
MILEQTVSHTIKKHLGQEPKNNRNEKSRDDLKK